MKFTNNQNLPQPVVDAILNDDYTKGPSDISITGLIAPPRIRVLKKLHDDEIVEDVSARVFALLGKIMHGILEKAQKQGLAEQRFYLEIEGLTISGQTDAYYEEGLLQDYKLVSLYQVQAGVKDDFIQQLNIYAYLMRHGYTLAEDLVTRTYHKYEVKALEDVFILRDWTKGKAKRDETMPQQQVIKLGVELWPEDKTLAFIVERIQKHKAANKKLPLCTPEERWATPDKYAVMAKPGAARSIKYHESLDEAKLHLAMALSDHPKALIEDRPGESKRCIDYCVVAPFCSQYANLKLKGE